MAASAWLTALAASAQVVQLPTFSSASVGTTVVVPDGGAAYLGGVSRAADGRNEFGVPGLPFPGFQSRGIGQERSASSFWVTATIHDFDAMDQALLNTPSPDGVAATYPTGFHGLPDAAGATAGHSMQSNGVNLAGSWQAQLPAPAPVSDVAAEHADRMARQAARATEADNYFARGQQAEADGKPNVAKIYYQMVARRGAGDVKQQALARLDVISGRTTALAKNSP